MIDFAQVVAKKYTKVANEIKPNLTLYREKKANAEAEAEATAGFRHVFGDEGKQSKESNSSLSYGHPDNKPSQESINKMANNLKEQLSRFVKRDF